MKVIHKIAILCILFSLTLACRRQPNSYPVIDANFTKVQVHQFGQKYHYYNEQINQHYYLVKIQGSSFQAGLAYGVLLKKQIRSLVDDIWSYYYSLAEEQFKFISKLPTYLQPAARTLAMKLFRSILYANYLVTKRYTPKRFGQEYAGISEGSGVSMKMLIELNMLPEYTRAGCSIFGAWGNATKNGDLYHLRALDWDPRNPINKYPVMAFYHLNEKGSHPFVNLGWAGFIGSLTGFGQFTGIGEKVRKQKPVKQNETRIGKPWTYALRDVIQFAQTIDQALQSLQNTRRTCSINVGISNIKNNTFRLIQYSHKQFYVYDDKNYTYTPVHQQMDSIVYISVHQDKGDACFQDLLNSNKRNVDGEWITNVLAASHHTGDTQLATFNFNTKELYFQVSNSTHLTFERPTLRVQLAPYFKF